MNKRERRKPHTCNPGDLGATLRGMDFNEKTVEGHGRLDNLLRPVLPDEGQWCPYQVQGGGERC